MKIIIFLISVISLNLLPACSKQGIHSAKNPTKGEPKDVSVIVSLKGCKSISFNDDQLKLCVDSISDSRCPSNVVCVWAGTAIVRFTFTNNGNEHPVVLAIPPFESFTQQIKVAGYTLTLINVSPYPVASPGTPVEVKKAEVKISNY
jgi:hypothetical protein